MSRKQELLQKRNEKIYKRYKQLYDVKSLQHQKVLELLSEEFYLLPDALGKIITNSKKVKVGAQKPATI